MEDDKLLLMLQQYGDQIINDYRRKLYEGRSNASGALGNSISTTINAEDGMYTVTINLLDYWRYVEYGRNPGSFPNITALRNWIEIKPIIPIPYNGKLPTIDQLTYLIGRKIEREGIEPRYYLTDTITELDLDPLKEEIDRALGERFTNTIKEVK